MNKVLLLLKTEKIIDKQVALLFEKECTTDEMNVQQKKFKSIYIGKHLEELQIVISLYNSLENVKIMEKQEIKIVTFEFYTKFIDSYKKI